MSKCHTDHADEYKAFCDASESKQGLAIHFAKKWREDHPKEWEKFEAAFAAEHAEASASSASEAEDKPKAKKTVAKKAVATAAPEVSESEAESVKPVKKVIKKAGGK